MPFKMIVVSMMVIVVSMMVIVVSMMVIEVSRMVIVLSFMMAMMMMVTMMMMVMMMTAFHPATMTHPMAAIRSPLVFGPEDVVMSMAVTASRTRTRTTRLMGPTFRPRTVAKEIVSGVSKLGIKSSEDVVRCDENHL